MEPFLSKVAKVYAEKEKNNLKLKNKKIVIVHGKGEGILKEKSHALLKKDKRVN